MLPYVPSSLSLLTAPVYLVVLAKYASATTTQWEHCSGLLFSYLGSVSGEHAYCGVNGRVSVHDTTSVIGWHRRVSEEEPGCPRTQYVVWTHGLKLPLGVHVADGLFFPVGTPGTFHQRLQCIAGKVCSCDISVWKVKVYFVSLKSGLILGLPYVFFLHRRLWATWKTMTKPVLKQL